MLITIVINMCLSAVQKDTRTHAHTHLPHFGPGATKHCCKAALFLHQESGSCLLSLRLLNKKTACLVSQVPNSSLGSKKYHALNSPSTGPFHPWTCCWSASWVNPRPQPALYIGSFHLCKPCSPRVTGYPTSCLGCTWQINTQLTTEYVVMWIKKINELTNA